MGTFWRLLGFLRPYRRGVIASLVLAVLAMAGTVLLPYLIGRAIDETRAGSAAAEKGLAFADHRGVLELIVVLVLVTAVLRLGLTVMRRLVAGRVSLGVEVDLRERLYSHLQSLEMAFFDRQQTGQLMSRATVDLQSVRFFLGYGLIFITQSGLTIVLGALAMFL
ncbi:MAG TPA: ABC transporter transmembrane domain-containing protein, partial [Solirubrobacteraceae bacterium]|nr:ABC transporter transmembrane domain-containing protein [Solirubrobacteraceae bacterium]